MIQQSPQHQSRLPEDSEPFWVVARISKSEGRGIEVTDTRVTRCTKDQRCVITFFRNVALFGLKPECEVMCSECFIDYCVRNGYIEREVWKYLGLARDQPTASSHRMLLRIVATILPGSMVVRVKVLECCGPFSE